MTPPFPTVVDPAAGERAPAPPFGQSGCAGAMPAARREAAIAFLRELGRPPAPTRLEDDAAPIFRYLAVWCIVKFQIKIVKDQLAGDGLGRLTRWIYDPVLTVRHRAEIRAALLAIGVTPENGSSIDSDEALDAWLGLLTVAADIREINPTLYGIIAGDFP